jgi:hypothetical protein
MKKIFVVLATRNESDIIESYCRYNLTFCDGMIIYERQSSDNTNEIIRKLIAEGLPIYLYDDPNVVFGPFSGGSVKTAMAYRAVNEYGADLVVPLDTDEFLYHTDGINPRETLEMLDETVEYQALWRTYVYEKEPDINLGFMPNNFIQYRNPVLEKIQGHAGTTFISKYLIQEKKAQFAGGAHWLLYPEESKNKISIENPEKLVCAHFPIRSKSQIIKKSIPNWIYKWNTTNRVTRDALDNFQLGILFNTLKNNGDITPKEMKNHSIDYSIYNLSQDMHGIKKTIANFAADGYLTINDSMDVSFCSDKLKLRYTNYNENNKAFIRATLTEIDKAVTFLSAESDEKSKYIGEIQKKHFPVSDGFVFLDTGNGFNPEEILQVPLFRHENYFEVAVTLPPNVKNIRFDPVEGNACILENIQIITDIGKIECTPINGIAADGLNLFDNLDPQILIELKGRNISRLQITGNMRHFIIDDISFLSKTKQVFEKYFETKSEVEVLTVEQDNLAAERDGLVTERNNLITEQDNLAAERDGLVTERNNLIAIRDGFLNSRSWRIAKPLRDFAAFVRRYKVLRLFAKGLLSIKRYGIIVTIKKVFSYSKQKKLQNISVITPVNPPVITGAVKIHNNDVDLIPWFRALQAIPSFVDEREKARINLVTDSIEKHSLLGGVATALIIATEFANKYGISLRIITRTTPVDPLDYKKIIKLNDIKEPEDVSFYSDYDRDENGKKNFKLDISKKDIFIATSWWSATAISKTNLTERFFYVLQEVETFFYPHSDEHYFCSKMMQKSNVDYIINSKYLFDYFKDNTPNIVNNGIYFIPAFSKSLYHKKSFTQKLKYNLFFYARPNNPRNLFFYGIYLLNKVFERGILDTSEWDVYLVGQNTPEITFNNGYKAINKGLLDWDQYATFLTDVDLAVSLMYTPHPSYPPYDVACSGGVVVSNTCLNKTEFPECKNVLLGDLEENSFLETMEKGIMLAKDIKERKKNFEKSTIQRSWPDTLKDILLFMEERSRNVLS